MSNNDTTANCYKCSTTEQLSVKTTYRDGRRIYICRSCRRLAYQQSKLKRIKKTREENQLEDKLQEYKRFANEKNMQIMLKYAHMNRVSQ